MPRDPFLSSIGRHSGRLPVPIFDILPENGVSVVFRPLPDAVSGWIERVGGSGFEVVINRGHTVARQRFTAAHLLAHRVYHRHLLDVRTGDDRSYRNAGTPFPNPRIEIRHERQANMVAANILMPEALVLPLLRDGMNTAALADRFGVSAEVMRIRLGRSARTGPSDAGPARP